jgi:hypothetical protein
MPRLSILISARFSMADASVAKEIQGVAFQIWWFACIPSASFRDFHVHNGWRGALDNKQFDLSGWLPE